MEKKKKLIIFGNTNYAEMVFDYFNDFSEYEVVAFTVDGKYMTSDTFYDKPLVSFDDIENIYPPSMYDIFVAVGSSKLNSVRALIFGRVKEKGYYCPSFIHPDAYVGPKVSIGENCIFMECSKTLTRSIIGNNVIVWPIGFISHNCIVRDNAYIVGSVNGYGEIGENCFLGAGAMVADKVVIAKDNFITMSAVVRTNTIPDSVYEGIPAKRRENISACRFADIISRRR